MARVIKTGDDRQLLGEESLLHFAADLDFTLSRSRWLLHPRPLQQVGISSARPVCAATGLEQAHIGAGVGFF